MYRNYYSEYAKRAEEIKSAVKAPRQDEPPAAAVIPEPTQNKKPANSVFRLKGDDILLGALILLLMKEKKADITLILALAFIFLSDLG